MKPDYGQLTADLFDAQAERDRILNDHRARRKILLVALNQKLEDLARAHAGLVTTDDASRLLGQMPEAAGLDPRFIGAVWRMGPWKKTGQYVPSYRRHATPIPVWRLEVER